jgi:RNA polymerase sigma-70 factor (ECF subfamily)
MPARANPELAALVRRLQAEGLTDELAEELYRRLYRPLHVLFASRPRLRERAEDLAHETLLRIFAAIGDFRFESSVETWAWRVAQNIAANAERDLQAAKRDAIELALDEAPVGGGSAPLDLLETPEPSPEDHAAGGELRRRAVRAVLDLPARMRRCWLLRDLHGLSERQTAAALGVTEGTVKSQMHEARKRLRAVLPELSDR